MFWISFVPFGDATWSSPRFLWTELSISPLYFGWYCFSLHDNEDVFILSYRLMLIYDLTSRCHAMLNILYIICLIFEIMKMMTLVFWQTCVRFLFIPSKNWIRYARPGLVNVLYDTWKISFSSSWRLWTAIHCRWSSHRLERMTVCEWRFCSNANFFFCLWSYIRWLARHLCQESCFHKVLDVTTIRTVVRKHDCNVDTNSTRMSVNICSSCMNFSFWWYCTVFSIHDFSSWWSFSCDVSRRGSDIGRMTRLSFKELFGSTRLRHRESSYSLRFVCIDSDVFYFVDGHSDNDCKDHDEIDVYHEGTLRTMRSRTYSSRLFVFVLWSMWTDHQIHVYCQCRRIIFAVCLAGVECALAVVISSELRKYLTGYLRFLRQSTTGYVFIRYCKVNRIETWSWVWLFSFLNDITLSAFTFRDSCLLSTLWYELFSFFLCVMFCFFLFCLIVVFSNVEQKEERGKRYDISQEKWRISKTTGYPINEGRRNSVVKEKGETK